VGLGLFGNGGTQFITNLTVNTTGATAGNTTLHGNINLDDSDGVGNGGTAPVFTITGNGNVIISNNITVYTAQGVDTDAGGNVNWNNSNVTPDAANFSLTIDTSTVAGENGGNVKFGAVNDDLVADQFLDTLTIDMDGDGGAVGVAQDGRLTFGRATPTLEVDGVAGTQDTTTIIISGIIDLEGTGGIAGTQVSDILFDTNASNTAINSGAIDLRDSVTDGATTGTNLIATTSGDATGGGAGNSVNAGNIRVGDMGTTNPFASLTFDTNGQTTDGVLVTHDSDNNGTTQLLLENYGSTPVFNVNNASQWVITSNTEVDTEAGDDETAGNIDLSETIVSSNGVFNLELDANGSTDGSVETGVFSNNNPAAVAEGGSFVEDVTIDGGLVTFTGDGVAGGATNFTINGQLQVNASGAVNINDSITTDRDDNADTFEIQAAGAITQAASTTIDVNEGQARIQSSGSSVTLVNLVSTASNGALPTVLIPGLEVQSIPRNTDAAANVAIQVQALTDVTTGTITNTDAGHIEVIAGNGSTAAGVIDDSGAGATGTINVGVVSTSTTGIVYMQATNTAGNGQILDAEAGADDNNDIVAAEFHARANDRIGVVETVSDADGHVYIDEEDTGFNGNNIDTSVTRVSLTTLDADSHIAIDNVDTGGGLFVDILSPGGNNDASAWIRNSAALDISALNIVSGNATLATDRLAFIATTGNLTFQAFATPFSQSVADTTVTDGATLKLEAAAGNLIHTGGVGNEAISYTGVNFIAKSNNTERFNTTTVRGDFQITGANNDLLVDETDGIIFLNLDGDQNRSGSGQDLSASATDAIEVRTNNTASGATTNTDILDYFFTSSTGNGILVGNSIGGVATPGGGILINVLDAHPGDVASRGDFRVGPTAAGGIDAFGQNGTNGIQIDVEDGHVLFGASSVTPDAVGDVDVTTAIGAGFGVDIDSRSGNFLVRIIASEGAFGTADERQMVVGDNSGGAPDVSIVAGATGSGNVYFDNNDNHQDNTPPSGTLLDVGGAGVNAGGNVIANDGQIEAQLSGPPNTGTGDLIIRGDFFSLGDISSDSGREIIFEAGANHIIFGPGAQYFSGLLNVAPGNGGPGTDGFSVIFLPGAFVSVNEDPLDAANRPGNFVAHDLVNFWMQDGS